MTQSPKSPDLNVLDFSFIYMYYVYTVCKYIYVLTAETYIQESTPSVQKWLSKIKISRENSGISQKRHAILVELK